MNAIFTLLNDTRANCSMTNSLLTACCGNIFLIIRVVCRMLYIMHVWGIYYNAILMCLTHIIFFLLQIIFYLRFFRTTEIISSSFHMYFFDILFFCWFTRINMSIVYVLSHAELKFKKKFCTIENYYGKQQKKVEYVFLGKSNVSWIMDCITLWTFCEIYFCTFFSFVKFMM